MVNLLHDLIRPAPLRLVCCGIRCVLYFNVWCRTTRNIHCCFIIQERRIPEKTLTSCINSLRSSIWSGFSTWITLYSTTCKLRFRAEEKGKKKISWQSFWIKFIVLLGFIKSIHFGYYSYLIHSFTFQQKGKIYLTHHSPPITTFSSANLLSCALFGITLHFQSSM